jgi:transposase InsO family protein
VGLSRSLVRYVAKWSKDEAMLIKKIHRLAIRHSRYGYRRITVLLRREGCKINRKRVHRIWKIESFNGKLRDELLNREIFTTLEEARVLIEQWRREYNQLRPHSALGYRPPAPEAILTTT